FNSVEDERHRNVRTLRDQATQYLESYGLRNRSKTFADYAIKHLLQFLGSRMLVDIDDTAVREYQDARLKEKAAPKTINEEVDLTKRFLIVAKSKTDAGEGRTIPLNSALYEALSKHAVWFELRFGRIEPDWYLFPFGKSKHLDPSRPVTTLKTAWRYVKKRA